MLLLAELSLVALVFLGKSRMLKKCKDLLIIYSCSNTGSFPAWRCNVWFDFRDTTVQTLTLQPSVKDGLIVYEDSPLVSKPMIHMVYRAFWLYLYLSPWTGQLSELSTCVYHFSVCLTGVQTCIILDMLLYWNEILGKMICSLPALLSSVRFRNWQGSSAYFLRLFKKSVVVLN